MNAGVQDFKADLYVNPPGDMETFLFWRRPRSTRWNKTVM